MNKTHNLPIRCAGSGIGRGMLYGSSSRIISRSDSFGECTVRQSGISTEIFHYFVDFELVQCTVIPRLTITPRDIILMSTMLMYLFLPEITKIIFSREEAYAAHLVFV